MAIETNELIDVQTLSPFKRFIMTIGNLPTSYLESMTYGEMLMWFCNYLQETVIPTVNNNALAVEELQNLYEELRTYVNDYFDNLDLTEEISNKLDQMALDGTLTNLIKSYIDPIMSAYEESIDTTVNDFTTSITNTVNTQNRLISEINTKVDSATSGSPLVATSTSEMTETDHVYVNTTDGNWYYYDGDSWEIGGVYQASVDNDTVTKLASDMEYLMINTDDYTVDSNYYIRGDSGVKESNTAGVATSFIDISGRTSNTIKVKTTLFQTYGLAVYDKNQKYLTGIYGNNATTYGYLNQTDPQSIQFIVPNDAYYIRACMRSIYYSQESDFEVQIAKVYSIYEKMFDNKITFESINMFNKNAVTNNYRVNPDNGNPQSLTDWSISEFIKADAETDYYFVSAGALGPIGFYNSNFGFISSIPNSGVSVKTKFTTPENTAFIRLSIKNEYLDITQLNKKLEKKYTPYKEQFSSSLIPDEGDIIVNPGDDLIQVLMDNQGKRILINEGTYDIEAIYKAHFNDNDYFDNYTGYTYGDEYVDGVGVGAGLPIFDGTQLIATSGSKFVFNYTGNNSNVRTYFSCFATGDGVVLDGIYCEAENLRYIVHDDFNYTGHPIHTIIRNCRMENNTSQCIGGGMALYGVYEIYNNVFKGSYKENVSYHNKQSYLAINEMTIKDNYFDTRLSLRHYGQSTKLSNVLVTNNNFGTAIELRKENPSVVNENINLIEWNNIIRPS